MNDIKDKLMRVALYIRVSTERQVKEGESLEAQEKALIDYSKKNNMIVIDKYIDGGESGQKLARTNLTRLLEDVKKDKIDLIIMTKLDRWFRSIADFYKVQEILNKHKVKWKTIWEEYDTTTASGEFWLNMSLSMARMEAKRTSERINSIFDFKYEVQKTVCSGTTKFGYDIDENKKYVINQEEKNILEDLFNFYLKTSNLNETTKWFSAKYKKVSLPTIKNYLKDTSYIGKFKNKKGKVIENFIPKLINDEVFDKVQIVLQKNIKNYPSINVDKEPYLFSGLLKCPTCKHNLSGNYHKTWNGNYVKYYKCKGVSRATCTNNKYINEKLLDNHIKNNLREEMTKIIRINEITPRENKNHNNIANLKNKMNKLVELYTKDLIDIGYYEAEYRKIKYEIEKIENEKKEINKFDTTLLKNLLKQDIVVIYDTLSIEEKRRLLRSFIEYIVVYDKNNIEIEPIKHFFNS